MVDLLYSALEDSEHRPVVRELVLSPVVVLKLAEVRLEQDSVGPRRHAHLLACVVNVAVIVILERGLEVKWALLQSSGERP